MSLFKWKAAVVTGVMTSLPHVSWFLSEVNKITTWNSVHINCIIEYTVLYRTVLYNILHFTALRCATICCSVLFFCVPKRMARNRGHWDSHLRANLHISVKYGCHSKQWILYIVPRFKSNIFITLLTMCSCLLSFFQVVYFHISKWLTIYAYLTIWQFYKPNKQK